MTWNKAAMGWNAAGQQWRSYTKPKERELMGPVGAKLGQVAGRMVYTGEGGVDVRSCEGCGYHLCSCVKLDPSPPPLPGPLDFPERLKKKKERDRQGAFSAGTDRGRAAGVLQKALPDSHMAFSNGIVLLVCNRTITGEAVEANVQRVLSGEAQRVADSAVSQLKARRTQSRLSGVRKWLPVWAAAKTTEDAITIKFCDGRLGFGSLTHYALDRLDEKATRASVLLSCERMRDECERLKARSEEKLLDLLTTEVEWKAPPEAELPAGWRETRPSRHHARFDHESGAAVWLSGDGQDWHWAASKRYSCLGKKAVTTRAEAMRLALGQEIMTTREAAK